MAKRVPSFNIVACVISDFDSTCVGQVDVFIDLNPSPGIQDSLVASNGDAVEASIMMPIGSSGVSGYGVSVEFDSVELDLSANGPATELLPPGFQFSFTPGMVGSVLEDDGNGIGTVSNFEATRFVPPGPANISDPITIGTINFNVAGATTDATSLDIRPGLFSVFDGFLDNNNEVVIPTFHGASIDINSAPGDFSGNSEVDVVDIDTLSEAVDEGVGRDIFDLNQDGMVDIADHDYWIREIANTIPGDSDLDGDFDTQDIINIFMEGLYQDEVQDNSGWAAGDFDGDRETTAVDLLIPFRLGVFELNTPPATRVVPEPSARSLVMISSCLLLVIASSFRRPRALRLQRAGGSKG